ncbi:DUF2059 domain-containing protein [Variovorax sp. UC122_21]|uniref:DUF2059 domain-containing protein n=1 Tax=Variovorax sp. UC122_21 TaxID=3374554 RepID=UPI0037569A71
MKKQIKLALLTVALAGSSMGALAQDKATLIKQFLDLQRPGIEALARGLVEQSSAPIAQAGSQYLQTQVPEAKREAAAKAADAELKKYYDDAYPIVRDKAVQLAPTTLTPLLEQSFTEDELKQLLAWINSPLSKKYQDLNPKMQTALTEKAGGRDPRLHRTEDAGARHQRRQGAGRSDRRSGTRQGTGQGSRQEVT